jgi:molybdopterin molybdotransferase
VWQSLSHSSLAEKTVFFPSNIVKPVHFLDEISKIENLGGSNGVNLSPANSSISLEIGPHRYLIPSIKIGFQKVPQSKAKVLMISVSEALQIVVAHSPTLTAEQIDLPKAMGRYLAQDVVADTDLPPFDRSQMDGYAVRAEDTEHAPVTLRIVGESSAGKGWHHELHNGEAVRIMTGAPVPVGADSVQQVELTRGGEKESVEIIEPVVKGRSIVRRGSEIENGVTVLEKGDQITAAAMAVLAAFGYSQVRVGRQPRISVLATGSELVPVDQQPGPEQIRDSNNYSIAAYAQLAGAEVERLPLAVDDKQDLLRIIGEAAERSDVVITSGGVSMGVYDFTKAALRELGAEIFFERVALRPGKPTVFGRLPSGTLVFGLPGNPVSVSVTFNLFARTALLCMQGTREPCLEIETAVLTRPTKGSLDRESYLPAQLRTSDEGQLQAEPLKWGGSSDFVNFVHSTALIIIPSGVKEVVQGTKVKIVKLPLA